MSAPASPPRPLTGTLVLDASRMLPGAVLARLLLDLGARVIKIEDPGLGDPMRQAPPCPGGVGAGFAAFYRGAESVCLDLRAPEGARALRGLARHADVLVESFRPGTLARWGLAPEALRALNGGLLTCSLSGFGAAGPLAGRVAHDLNLVAYAGLLAMLPGTEVPRTQLADVTSGLLAGSAILAGLLERARTGRGRHLDQPLALGPAPFMTWAWADAAAGGGGWPERLLAGDAPAYRLYTCADGRRVALGAIEPKFWAELVQAMGLARLAPLGLDTGEAGGAAAAELARAFLAQPRAHWLALAEARNLPLTPVNQPEEARLLPPYAGETAYLPSWGAAPGRAPALGEGSARVLGEFGLAAPPADQADREAPRGP
jgi:crotonobetainyl-CoA:carnitine CoA-transferase CaiB-like acyl-CoA transferase